MGSEYPNSGPQTGMESTLTTKPSPQPSTDVFFFFRKFVDYGTES